MILLLCYAFIAQSYSQNMRSLRLFRMNGKRYQCTNVGCSPSSITVVPSLRSCQLTCLAKGICRTLTFDSSTSRCQLFVDTPSQYGQLLTETDVVTMTATDARQLSARKYNIRRFVSFK